MALTADDIIKIMAKAKELGLFEGSPPAPTPTEPEEVYVEPQALDQPTDEEVLYWSTPWYDHLMAEKEAKRNRIKEELNVKEL